VGAFDLVAEGLAEIRVSALVHTERDHVELFAERRVASRLLPATSLFSVIGSTPSSEWGSVASYHLFPRLDLGGTIALSTLGETLGYRAALRTRLRFSDADGGQLSVEGSRRALADEAWSGVLLSAELPIRVDVRLHASVELVAADHPRDRGALWPWTRAGASYALGEHWLFAAGVGAKASPEVASEFEALGRVSYRAQVWP